MKKRITKRYREARNMPDYGLEPKALHYLHLADKDALKKQAEIRAYATELIDRYDSGLVFLGAQLYEKVGKGYKAVPKLTEALERDSGFISEADAKKINNFIKRNSKRKGYGLEGRISVFILFSIAGIVLVISSLTPTGNTISNLTNTTQGLFGILLFVVGLAGLVFSKK